MVWTVQFNITTLRLSCWRERILAKSIRVAAILSISREYGTHEGIYFPNLDTDIIKMRIPRFRLLKCGDINPNPGPTKYPCACCERPCKNNQRALQCDGCNLWCHAKCTRVSQDEYNRLSSTDDTWYCNACTFKWLSDSFFSDSTEDSLNNSNSTNSDTSEPNVIADYKASIAAYYKFNLSIAHLNPHQSSLVIVRWNGSTLIFSRI